MGHLPLQRIYDLYPFSVFGVDFCGPIHKSYIALFVCFASKATHFKDSSSFRPFNWFMLLAFKRFVGHRECRAKNRRIEDETEGAFWAADIRGFRLSSLEMSSRRDGDALTPGHLLIGGPPIAPPATRTTGLQGLTSLRRWRLDSSIEKMVPGVRSRPTGAIKVAYGVGRRSQGEFAVIRTIIRAIYKREINNLLSLKFIISKHWAKGNFCS